MSKGRRQPTGAEIQLWQKVTESVAPLERTPARPRQKAKAPPKPETKPPVKAPAAAPVAKPPARKPVAPPSLDAFDRRTLGRIGRGTVAIDARTDLHGLTQEAAQQRLVRFLERAQADGAKLALVITGKGKPDGERGVLRRLVPMWLASPKLRPLVVGFDEAGPTHGGGGALYVRIRRAGKAVRG